MLEESFSLYLQIKDKGSRTGKYVDVQCLWDKHMRVSQILPMLRDGCVACLRRRLVLPGQDEEIV